MLLEVLRCCFSTSTGLGNLSHDATLVRTSWAILPENFLKFFGSIWHFYEVKVVKNLSR